MSRNLTVLLAVFLGCVAESAVPLYGQVGGVPVPGGSPFSPWLNLYQRKGGPIDNYNMFVQPALQQQNALQNLQYGVQHNAAAVNSVADQFTSATDAYGACRQPDGQRRGLYEPYEVLQLPFLWRARRGGLWNAGDGRLRTARWSRPVWHAGTGRRQRWCRRDKSKRLWRWRLWWRGRDGDGRRILRTGPTDVLPQPQIGPPSPSGRIRMNSGVFSF